MKDEYLWSGKGERDYEVERLEKRLSGFRYDENGFDATRSTRRVDFKQRTPNWRWIAGLSAAALSMLMLGLVIARQLAVTRQAAPTGWTVRSNKSVPRALMAGQVIETGRLSGANLSSDAVGEVDVEPNSRLRFVKATGNEHRLALEHGTIHAFIWAPPREFVVDTASATTVDLGCRYSLKAEPDGTGTVHVEIGWVAFESKHVEVFIPAGATCTTRPKRGPGTPYFDDAPQVLRRSLEQFDETGNSVDLQAALAAARPRDALSLWHLMTRTQGHARGEVFDRLSVLVSLPPAATRDRVLQGDSAAMDAAWNALDLGDTAWWREWKQRW